MWLRECVNSIVNQTYDGWQCYIVDDHSTDESLTGLPDDARIKIIPSKGHGLVAALNLGLEVSSGKYVARMDGDDIMYPDRLKRQLEYLNQHQLDWVGCQVEHMGGNPRLDGYASYIQWHNHLTHMDEMIKYRFVECPMLHPTWFLKREVFSRFGTYHEGCFPEDYEFFLRAGQHYRIGKVPDLLLKNRDWPGRVSRTADNFSDIAFMHLKLSYLNFNKESAHFWILGNGRGATLWAKLLMQAQYCIRGFIDVNPAKKGKLRYGFPIVLTDEFMSCFQKGDKILNTVMTKGQRNFVENWLSSLGLAANEDYVHLQ